MHGLHAMYNVFNCNKYCITRILQLPSVLTAYISLRKHEL